MQVKPRCIPELFAVFVTEKTFYDLIVFLSDFCMNMMNGCISFAGLTKKTETSDWVTNSSFRGAATGCAADGVGWGGGGLSKSLVSLGL